MIYITTRNPIVQYNVQDKLRAVLGTVHAEWDMTDFSLERKHTQKQKL
jgi:hypothetical protein